MRKLSVNTGMSRPPKPAAQAKRVAPPAVPDVYRHSGSSFGSAGYGSSEDAGGFLALPDTPNTLGMRVPREPLTHKAAVYYHQQLALQEDQGIDLTQSPGRDSPGSSSGSAGSGSRHSTASLDSGRASSYHTQASSTRGALSSPRCSVSSCSIGSVDRMSQRTEHEIINDWLRDLCFDEYAQLFSAAGYDMPTISRMTPEDLTAIGIKKPHHRERIKQHIDALQLPDNLPNNVPGSIEEWLRLLRLDEYVQPLLAQGYETVRDVTQLPWEDMEDIGIVKLGHQKKLLLAIKRVKDIISGKWVPQGLSHCNQSTYYGLTQQPLWSQPPQSQPLHSTHLNASDEYQLYHQSCLVQQQQYQQLHQQQAQQMVAWEQQHMMSQSAFMEKETNDIVLIKLRQPRGKSLESLEDPAERMTGTHLTFTRPTETSYYCHQTSLGLLSGGAGGAAQYQHSNIQQMPWRRSYDDGDITPTNEIGIGCCDQQQGGGTLPRHHRGGIPRQRPVAKVMANVTIQPQPQLTNTDYSNEKLIMCPTKCYGMHCARPPMVCNKKQAPEPPRRQCSVTNSIDQMGGHFDGIPLTHQTYSQHHPSQQQQQQQQHYMTHHVQQPLYANYAGQTHQTTVEIHAEKANDSKSNSSMDSIDAIPFANDNAGTIKQRAMIRQDLQSSLSSSSSSSSLATTVANVGQTLPLSAMKGSTSSGTATTTTTPSPTLSSASSMSIGVMTMDNTTAATLDSNVLNDIGNMLANLTDELDAMLEEEKRAGLNDSE